MLGDLKSTVQLQFGAASKAYAESPVHARGQSLDLLLAALEPKPSWQVLDVACGAGHTGLAFAPHVRQVTAVDLTEAMLFQTAKLAASRHISNLATQRGDAEQLPFPNQSFDLVTCRLAFHHFPHPEQALAEFARVLKPEGRLGFTDNFTVANSQAAEAYNAYEKLRDSSHYRVYSLASLQAMMTGAGLHPKITGSLTKEFEFQQWANRQHASPANKDRLLSFLENLPDALRPQLAPHFANGIVYFSLWEVVIVASPTVTAIG